MTVASSDHDQLIRTGQGTVCWNRRPRPTFAFEIRARSTRSRAAWTHWDYPANRDLHW